MKHQIKLKKNRGFSLVEMLVVIAVIGIIAGIAVPSIGSVSGKANEAKAKRNGQTIASLYNSSRGVGASYTATTTSGIIDELIAGKAGPELAGTEFKMSALPDEEKTEAMKYVSYDSDTDMMSYDPEGTQVVAAASDPEPEPEPVSDGWENFKFYPTAADAQNYITILNSHPFYNHPTGYFSTNVTWRVGPVQSDGQFPVQYMVP